MPNAAHKEPPVSELSPALLRLIDALAALRARIEAAPVGEVGVLQFDVDAYCNEVWTETDALAGVKRVRLLADEGGVT